MGIIVSHSREGMRGLKFHISNDLIVDCQVAASAEYKRKQNPKVLWHQRRLFMVDGTGEGLMKRTAFILTIWLFVLSLALGGCGNSRKSYEQAKAGTVRYLDKHRTDLLELAGGILLRKSAEEATYGNMLHISYDENAGGLFVIFDIDAQGMLGGQYWGLYYSPDNLFNLSDPPEDRWTRLDEDRCYWQEEDGNNFFAMERLEDHWFFYYRDFDGNVHGLDWAADAATESSVTE